MVLVFRSTKQCHHCPACHLVQRWPRLFVHDRTVSSTHCLSGVSTYLANSTGRKTALATLSTVPPHRHLTRTASTSMPTCFMLINLSAPASHTGLILLPPPSQPLRTCGSCSKHSSPNSLSMRVVTLESSPSHTVVTMDPVSFYVNHDNVFD